MGSCLGRPEGNSAPHGVAMTRTNPTWLQGHGQDPSLFSAESLQDRSRAVRTADGLSTASAGSVAKLEWIIAELLPADIAMDVMTRRGAEMKHLWESLTTTPLYEELTVWVMAAWPDAMVERVDTMVRTAIASAVLPLFSFSCTSTAHADLMRRLAVESRAHASDRSGECIQVEVLGCVRCSPSCAVLHGPCELPSAVRGRSRGMPVGHRHTDLGKTG